MHQFWIGYAVILLIVVIACAFCDEGSEPSASDLGRIAICFAFAVFVCWTLGTLIHWAIAAY